MQDSVEFLRSPLGFEEHARKTSNTGIVREKLASITKIVELKTSGDQTRIVKDAIDIFNQFYDHKIRDLKRMFPDDHVSEDG